MPVFFNKTTFDSLGAEEIKPSNTHASQDCSLCTNPLAVHPSNPIDEASKYHIAVRIRACGHILGKDCLDAWLEVGSACPICNRLLFQAQGHRITQDDINAVVESLGRRYGEGRVMRAIARLMARQEEENARLHKVHQAEMAKLADKDAQAKKDEYMSVEDFLDSEGEMDFF